MKLYVWRKPDQSSKVYLDRYARTRQDLRIQFGGDWFVTNIDGCQYSVNEVFAEKETSNTAAGAVIGGLIGVLGGPVGLILGAGLGGAIGNSSDEDEQRRVNVFNTSY